MITYFGIHIFNIIIFVGTDNVRRLGFLGRAKSRTLKMTIIIVIVFVVCWTPYYIMAIW